MSTTTDFSIIFFQKSYLDLPITKQKSNIRTLRKKLGKHVKQNYNATFSHLQEKVILHRSNIFVSSNKEGKTKILPCKWTLFTSLVFSLLHSISTCPIFANNLLQTHNILLKQFRFYLSYTYVFLSNQDQALVLKIAYIFKVFGAQSCLIVVCLRGMQ